MKNRLINVVATKRIMIGDTEHGPVPAAESIGASRRANYVFVYPLQAAKALHRSGSIAPAYLNDARALRSLGVHCQPYFGELEPEVGDSNPEIVAHPSDDLQGEVEAALESGLKADLVAALESVGLDPADYGNNDERAAALTEWLEG